MTLVPPSENDVREFARAHRLELTDAEARSLAAAVEALIPALDSIDSLTPDPQPSVTRYRDRQFGDRPSRADDPLNAIVRRCRVRGAAAGKLAGKRIGLKDSVCLAGIPASGGSHVLQGYAPDADATIVERMLDAGAEIVAMLNMDDFALSGDGRTSAYGATLNPHNPAYCSGGSSSGSAAALYYDWVDITIGTDQGGSIRIPSSWSGTVGLKPTYGLVPYTGVMSIDPSLDHVGPMARSVRDVALMLEVIAGTDPLDPRQRQVPQQAQAPQAYTEVLNRGVAGLKLAVLREGFEQPGAQVDVNAAVRGAVDSLAKLGAKAEAVSVPAHHEATNLLWAIVGEGMIHLARTGLQSAHFNGRYNPGLAEFFGTHWPERAAREASTVKMMIVLGQYLSTRAHGRIYAKAQNHRVALTAAYDRVLANFDAIVMPSTPMKASRQDEQSPYSMITNTAPFDATGHPGLSIPCAMSQGLPVGMMLIGRHFDEATLLRIGSAFENTVDWLKS
jgi:amidase